MSDIDETILRDHPKPDKDSLLMEFLEADQDPGNREIKNDFTSIEGQDFIGIGEY